MFLNIEPRQSNDYIFVALVLTTTDLGYLNRWLRTPITLNELKGCYTKTLVSQSYNLCHSLTIHLLCTCTFEALFPTKGDLGHIKGIPCVQKGDLCTVRGFLYSDFRP